MRLLKLLTFNAKGLDVHDKSSNFGLTAGFVPKDPWLSKKSGLPGSMGPPDLSGETVTHSANSVKTYDTKLATVPLYIPESLLETTNLKKVACPKTDDFTKCAPGDDSTKDSRCYLSERPRIGDALQEKDKFILFCAQKGESSETTDDGETPKVTDTAKMRSCCNAYAIRQLKQSLEGDKANVHESVAAFQTKCYDSFHVHNADALQSACQKLHDEPFYLVYFYAETNGQESTYKQTWPLAYPDDAPISDLGAFPDPGVIASSGKFYDVIVWAYDGGCVTGDIDMWASYPHVSALERTQKYQTPGARFGLGVSFPGLIRDSYGTSSLDAGELSVSRESPEMSSFYWAQRQSEKAVPGGTSTASNVEYYQIDALNAMAFAEDNLGNPECDMIDRKVFDSDGGLGTTATTEKELEEKKKIRHIRKMLRDIDALEEKPRDKLNPDQITKLGKKVKFETDLANLLKNEFFKVSFPAIHKMRDSLTSKGCKLHPPIMHGPEVKNYWFTQELDKELVFVYPDKMYSSDKIRSFELIQGNGILAHLKSLAKMGFMISMNDRYLEDDPHISGSSALKYIEKGRYEEWSHNVEIMNTFARSLACDQAKYAEDVVEERKATVKSEEAPVGQRMNIKYCLDDSTSSRKTEVDTDSGVESTSSVAPVAEASDLGLVLSVADPKRVASIQRRIHAAHSRADTIARRLNDEAKQMHIVQRIFDGDLRHRGSPGVAANVPMRGKYGMHLDETQSRRSEVAIWLRRLRMERYISTFLISGFVSFHLVAGMTSKDLSDIGIAKAHAAKVLLPAIRRLQVRGAIAFERAKNAADLAHDAPGALVLHSKAGYVAAPIPPRPEEKMGEDFEYDYAWENERFSTNPDVGWGRGYPRSSNLLPNDPSRWTDSCGCKTDVCPGNMFSIPPNGWRWVGRWGVVQPACPKTGRPSGDRSGWVYGTSFASLKLAGGVWLSPKPFTMIRRRLWRRARRAVSFDEDVKSASIETRASKLLPDFDSEHRVTTSDRISDERLSRIERMLIELSEAQRCAKEARAEDSETSNRDARYSLEARRLAEKEMHEAVTRATRREAALRKNFEGEISNRNAEIERLKTDAARDSMQHKKQKTALEIEIEKLREDERSMRDRVRELTAEIAKVQRDAHEQIEHIQTTAEDSRKAMDMQAKLDHEKLLQASRLREERTRAESARHIAEIEKKHVEAAKRAATSASRSLDALIRENANELSRANDRTMTKVAVERKRLIGEIDRVRRDAQVLISKSLQESLAEIMRERALRRQTEEALASASRSCGELRMKLERVESESRLSEQKTKLIKRELEVELEARSASSKQSRTAEEERASLLRRVEHERDEASNSLLTLQTQCDEKISQAERRVLVERAKVSMLEQRLEDEQRRRRLVERHKLELQSRLLEKSTRGPIVPPFDDVHQRMVDLEPPPPHTLYPTVDEENSETIGVYVDSTSPPSIAPPQSTSNASSIEEAAAPVGVPPGLNKAVSSASLLDNGDAAGEEDNEEVWKDSLGFSALPPGISSNSLVGDNAHDDGGDDDDDDEEEEEEEEDDNDGY
eukprot:g2168.t1